MILVGICDYLEATREMQCGEQQAMDPHLESAITRVVRQMILKSLKKQAWTSALSAEITAANGDMGAPMGRLRSGFRLQTERLRK